MVCDMLIWQRDSPLLARCGELPKEAENKADKLSHVGFEIWPGVQSVTPWTGGLDLFPNMKFLLCFVLGEDKEWLLGWEELFERKSSRTGVCLVVASSVWFSKGEIWRGRSQDWGEAEWSLCKGCGPCPLTLEAKGEARGRYARLWPTNLRVTGKIWSPCVEEEKEDILVLGMETQ